MKSGRRSYRVAEQVRELLAWELQRVGDPRLNMVTITSVMLSPDLRNGKVYWMASGGEEKKEEINSAFIEAASIFKKAMARKLSLRLVPNLRFYYDDTLDVSESVTRLLDKVRSDLEKSDDETDSFDEELANGR
jgi:ribosome-binding factor A